MYIRTEGLIVTEKTIGERDKLLTILTKSEGLVRVFARGAKNLQNRNAAATQLFCYADFVLYKGKNKYTLSESAVKEFFFDLRKDILKLSLAEYFFELTISLTFEDDSTQDTLRLLLNSLHYIQNVKIPADLLKVIFEMRILSISGYMPNLVCCKNCNAYDENLFFFVPHKAAIYCQKCVKNERGIWLHKGSVSALRHIIYADFTKLFLFKVSNKALQEIHKATENYMFCCLSKSFKTLDFYSSMRSVTQ